jgi:hypothetical protein
LIANSVAVRTRELSIRLALAGVLAGSVAAGFSAQLLRHLIWGVEPGDPLTFG